MSTLEKDLLKAAANGYLDRVLKVRSLLSAFLPSILQPIDSLIFESESAPFSVQQLD